MNVLLLTVPAVIRFVLPGKLVGQHESVDAAARRVLQRLTGLTAIFLEQFAVFGQLDRGNADFGRQIARANGVELPADHWFGHWFVSVGYYALVNFAQVIPPARGRVAASAVTTSAPGLLCYSTMGYHSKSP